MVVPAPDPLPQWLVPWAVWKIKGADPAKRPAAPARIPEWALWFPAWVKWRKVWAGLPGADAHRPPGTPVNIPKWAWKPAIEVLQKLKPPPPPPPVGVPYPPDSWKLPFPLMYTSRGWLDDEEFRSGRIITKMVASGVKTVALQAGAFANDTGDRLRWAGLHVCVWGVPDSSDQLWIDKAGAEGYMPQVEGYWEFQRTITNFENGVGAGLSKGIVMTASALNDFTFRIGPDGQQEITTTEAERLLDAGVSHCNVECYMSDMTPTPLADGVWNGKHRGMPYQSPLASYLGIGPSAFGDRIGVFLAEPMSDQHWEELSQL